MKSFSIIKVTFIIFLSIFLFSVVQAEHIIKNKQDANWLINKLVERENKFIGRNLVVKASFFNREVNEYREKTIQLLYNNSFSISEHRLNTLKHYDNKFYYSLRLGSKEKATSFSHLFISFNSGSDKKSAILDLISYGGIKISALLDICTIGKTTATKNNHIIELKIKNTTQKVKLFISKNNTVIEKINIETDTTYSKIFHFNDYHKVEGLYLPQKFLHRLIIDNKDTVYEEGNFEYLVQKKRLFDLDNHWYVYVQDNRLYPPESYRVMYPKGWLGIVFNPHKDNEIKKAIKGSPASKSGLQKGDIIIGADNIKLKNNYEILQYVATKNIGENISVDILRNSKKISLSLKKEKVPRPEEYTKMSNIISNHRTSILTLEEIYKISKTKNKEIQTIPYKYTIYNERRYCLKTEEGILKLSPIPNKSGKKWKCNWKTYDEFKKNGAIIFEE